MPLYEFHCDDCHNEFEQLFGSVSSEPRAACPKCGSENTHRKLSLFGFASKDGNGRSRSSRSACATCRASSCTGCRK